MVRLATNAAASQQFDEKSIRLSLAEVRAYWFREAIQNHLNARIPLSRRRPPSEKQPS